MRALAERLIESGTKRPSSTEGWRTWVPEHFAADASKPFSDRHIALWDWFESINLGEPMDPRVDVWPRGGGKSSTGQMGCAYVGDRGTRKFCLFVSETQEQADKLVDNVSKLLLSLGHQAAVNKLGYQKGWRRNQLRASNGFNVAAFGLDTGARGVKLDEFRPDLFIFDDIDGRHDSPRVTGKKEAIITQTLLPAGSSDAIVLFLQNLIIEDGIVARMVNGKADYLLNAEIRGPEPALLDCEVEDDILENGKPFKRIVRGEPTWEGQNIEICQRQIIQWGWTAFKREALHQVEGADGLFFDVEALHTIEPSEIPADLRLARGWDLAATQGGGDYTGGVLMGYSRTTSRVYIIDVRHEQYASNDVRDLIERTGASDRQGIIYEPDIKRDNGAFVRRGAEAFRFHPAYMVKLLVPQDVGQAGKYQAEQFKKEFSGEALSAVIPSGPKSVRARGLQAAVNEGRVSMVKGAWNHAYRDELRRFREDGEHDHDDLVDASADAYNELVGPAKVLTLPPAARLIGFKRHRND